MKSYALAAFISVIGMLPIHQTMADGCTSAATSRRAIRHAIPATNPPKQTLYKLDTAKYQGAVCNDGTPGAYWFRPGTGDGATRWIIYLEDGKKCVDNTSCALRAQTYPTLISSSKINNRALTGVVSSDPGVSETFYDANAVEIHYCSSDYWSGHHLSGVSFDPNDAQDTWSFEGRAIAKAVVADLIAQHGFNAATDVLWSGSAAGGLGIILIANDLIPSSPPGARVLVMNDAGYAIDVDGYDPNGSAPNYTSSISPTPTEQIVLEGMTLWRGRGDLPCTKAATTQQERNLCMYSSYVISEGWIPVPVLDMESQIDSAQMQDNGWVGPNKKNTPAYGYSSYFANQMAPSLSASGSVNSVFAPYQLIHNMTNTDAKFDGPLNFQGVMITPDQALATWYNDPCNREVLIGNP